MGLSLMTMMGHQKPTRHEKYVIGECIKVIRYNKYPEDEIDARFKKMHNRSLDNIIKDLAKILARPVREDRIIGKAKIFQTIDCRCADVSMPTCKEVNNDMFKEKREVWK